MDFSEQKERIRALPARVKEILMGLLGRQEENDEFPVERLKQIADRLETRLDCDASETGELRLEAASQQSAQLGVVRWCGNSDRYLTQEVRGPAGLEGAYKLFEIDPMSKMPD
ncbi:MAG: hypothetical protein IPM23_10095 [Candidatus Melainabacteria bacterium]|nr:hypothetical protein [Candidatus Melainabacteria bacterium]